MQFSDAQLQAYARGDLDYNDARILEEAMAVEPRIARRAVTVLMERRLGIALPDRRSDSVGESDLELPSPAVGDDLPGARGSQLRANFLPLTAAAFAVLLVGAGYFAAHSSRSGADGVEVGKLASKSLVASLASVPTGSVDESGGGTFRAISSFKSSDGALCREFSFTDAAGDRHAIACREPAGWAVTFALFEPRGKNDEYVPADGNDLVNAYLTRVGAGAPLSTRAEVEALGTAR